MIASARGSTATCLCCPIPMLQLAVTPASLAFPHLAAAGSIRFSRRNKNRSCSTIPWPSRRARRLLEEEEDHRGRTCRPAAAAAAPDWRSWRRWRRSCSTSTAPSPTPIPSTTSPSASCCNRSGSMMAWPSPRSSTVPTSAGGTTTPSPAHCSWSLIMPRPWSSWIRRKPCSESWQQGSSSQPARLLQVDRRPQPGARRITEFFLVLVVGSECGRAKASPDPYLKTLELIYASPDHTFIFEDSASGTVPVSAAGVAVVGLTTRNPEKVLSDAGACLLIRDFQDPKLLSVLAELEPAVADKQG